MVNGDKVNTGTVWWYGGVLRTTLRKVPLPSCTYNSAAANINTTLP